MPTGEAVIPSQVLNMSTELMLVQSKCSYVQLLRKAERLS